MGSAESYEYDQMLEHFFMNLKSKGTRTFEIDVDPPDPSKIPTVEDLIGASVIMICVFYRSQEFFRFASFDKGAATSSTTTSCKTKSTKKACRRNTMMSEDKYYTIRASYFGKKSPGIPTCSSAHLKRSSKRHSLDQ